jgi:NAD(P)-dependent dehydrogenase (short-subunit alcohol dehydrogenase family)
MRGKVVLITGATSGIGQTVGGTPGEANRCETVGTASRVVAEAREIAAGLYGNRSCPGAQEKYGAPMA